MTAADIAEFERTALAAEAALQNASAANSSEIENYFAGGGTGPFPGLDSIGLAKLQQAAIEARAAFRMAQRTGT